MKEVIAVRGKETRSFSELQWQLIGSNPENNGGWSVKAPKEAKPKKQKDPEA